MAAKIARDELFSLERYAEIRSRFRAQVMEHKRNRRVLVGPHAVFLFEDKLTMHYQVQEMLRAERIFDAEGIAQELAAYNPLVPDGSNWKATFMMEYEDAEQRATELGRLLGVEDRVWLRVGKGSPVFAFADEDLPRANAQKTSAVHFLRFELSPVDVSRVKEGAPVAMGIDHVAYPHRIAALPENVRASLVMDLD